ncbi:MAG: hypothetical protein BWY55_00741 [archaeon ADurb.Bin336]|jgi:hypothetical protein|nr:MAG: hypothetical protein BWY55_00741 [archaeon ADurb.Bin336]
MFVRKTILLRLGTRDFRWTQVLGIFLGIITVLMLVQSSAVMFDSWQVVRDFNKCVEFSGINELSSLVGTDQLLAQMRFMDCKDSLYQITGAQIPAMQRSITSRQIVTALVEPVVGFFFWAALFLFALFLIFNEEVVIPIEEIEQVARPFRKKK